MNFSIRPADEEDLEAILRLERLIFPVPWTQVQFQDELRSPLSTVWVLTDDETDAIVAGYAVFWTLAQIGEGEIHSLAVAPAYRKRGHGRFLLTKILATYRRAGVTQVHLQVRKSNEAAIAIYEAVRFRITGIHRGRYQDGEDAFCMSWRSAEVDSPSAPMPSVAAH